MWRETHFISVEEYFNMSKLYITYVHTAKLQDLLDEKYGKKENVTAKLIDITKKRMMHNK